MSGSQARNPKRGANGCRFEQPARRLNEYVTRAYGNEPTRGTESGVIHVQIELVETTMILGSGILATLLIIAFNVLFLRKGGV